MMTKNEERPWRGKVTESRNIKRGTCRCWEEYLPEWSIYQINVLCGGFGVSCVLLWRHHRDSIYLDSELWGTIMVVGGRLGIHFDEKFLSLPTYFSE